MQAQIYDFKIRRVLQDKVISPLNTYYKISNFVIFVQYSVIAFLCLHLFLTLFVTRFYFFATKEEFSINTTNYLTSGRKNNTVTIKLLTDYTNI